MRRLSSGPGRSGLNRERLPVDSGPAAFSRWIALGSQVMNRARKTPSTRDALLSFAALLLYALVALLPFDRLVLCVRADGSFDLEVAGRFAACIDCGRADGASERPGCCSRSEAGSGEAPCRDTVVLQRTREPGMPPAHAAVASATPL